ncbi:MAG: hypothetical protein R2761_04745 [Acidimicrobiales bacterium]
MGWAIGSVLAVVAGASLLAGVWSADRSERAGRTGRWGRVLVLRGYPLLIVVIGLGVLFVVPASVVEGEGGWSGSNIVSVLVAIVVTLLGAFALFVLGRNLAGHDPDAGRIAARLSGDEPSRLLLTRWLQRVRWRRWLGGFLGVLSALLLSVDGSGPNIVLSGFAGIMLGSLSAELHHWRRPDGGGARAADLTRRRLSDYTSPGEQWLLGAAAMGAVILAATDLAGTTAHTTDRGPGWPWAGTALGVVAGVVAMQWRIVTRRRPALPPELRRADDLARRLAVSRGMAQPGLALALALLAEASTRVGLGLVAAVCWLLAVGVWLGTRRLGLDKLLSAPPANAAPEPAGA